MKKVFALLVLCFLASGVSAQVRMTGVFVPTVLYVSGADNYQMRVFGAISATCPSGFAYVNQSDPASKTYFAALMLAYSNGKRLNLSVAPPDAIGACRIFDVIVQD